MTALPVDVVRSKRRKRTIQAYVVDGRVRVLVPAGLPLDEETRLVDSMVARVTRRFTSTTVDLDARARHLARKYDLPVPNAVVWSDRQLTRWGSCTPSDGKIRLSNRLASMPERVNSPAATTSRFRPPSNGPIGN